MKTCTQCRKIYEDDNLNYCLEDGGALLAADPTAPTVVVPPPRNTGSQAPASPTQWQPPAPPSQQPRSSSKTWLWALLIAGILLLLCGGGVGAFLLYSLSQSDAITDKKFPTPSFQSPEPLSTTSPSTTKKGTATSGALTMANYKRLNIGMSRPEVEEILGSSGTELSSSRGGGMSFDVIQWEGEDFKSIIVTFQNNKIMSKTQVGLDD